MPQSSPTHGESLPARGLDPLTPLAQMFDRLAHPPAHGFGCRIPDLRGAIGRSGHQPPAVRTE